MTDHNIAAIRKLLIAAFTAEEVHRFCQDRPLFQPIVDRFGPNDGLDDMVDEAIIYCQKRFLFDQLLDEVQRYNPTQYDRCGPYRTEAGEGVYAPPTLPAPYLPPRPLPDFVGREDQLQSLDVTLVPGSKTAITGIIGMVGIGKTELAKLAASRAAGRFRDGVLWADCATQTLTAIADLWAAAYEKQLHGNDPAAKAAAWRSLIAGKEALLIFDNLQPDQEIEPLLPARGRSGVLITTDDAHHLALEGAARLDLDRFSTDDALKLARKVLGAEPADAQASDARRLFELLGYLPLAVAVALHVARDCGWTLDILAGKLRAAGALRVLGDDTRLRQSLNATFDTAHRTLSADLHHTFGSLALFNAGPSFSSEALADTLALDLAEAQARLSALAARSLLRPAGEGRWSLHPLLREFAVAQEPDATGGSAAALRFARHYARLARAANDLYMRGGDDLLRGLALFDLEWPHIRQGQSWAAARSADDGEAAALASDYPRGCASCLDLRLPPRDRIPWREAGAAAARRLGDKQAEGAHLSNLGIAHAGLGDARAAIGYYEQALAIAREICAASTKCSAEWTKARGMEGDALGNLGTSHFALGDARAAIGYCEQALAIAREICAAFTKCSAEWTKARRGEGSHLVNLGNAYLELGDTRAAVGYYEQALAIAREIGDRRGEGGDLGNLGLAYETLGDTHSAIGCYEQALAIAREIGDRRGEGRHLGNLGIAYKALGDTHSAIGFYEQALAIAREIGDRRGEGNRLANLGLAHKTLGDLVRARELWTQALAIFGAIEDPHAAEVSRLLQELGPP